MGQNAHHPIRQRLAAALRAVLPDPVRPFETAHLPENLTDTLGDDTALRDWVLRHHARYGLDPVWILTGQGCAPQGDGQGSTRLVPVFAMSPIDPQSGRWRPMTVERIALSETIVTPVRFVVRMEDRAMEPRIRRGAYLVVDVTQTRIAKMPEALPDQADQAKIFAVDVPGEGLVVRIARHEARTDRLVLTGSDPSAPPLVMPWSTAVDRLVGRVVWIAQTL